MRLATVYYWNKGDFEAAPRWHKMATYSKEVALEVIHDKGIFEALGTDRLCVVDEKTAKILATIERRKNNV